MKDDKVTEIRLSGGYDAAAEMAGILQYGFSVVAETGITVREFLERTCGIDPEYAVKRITTLFLTGKPVDKRDEAVITEGCTLSLSGSMPGLMGIMMRSGSPYSTMRSSITFRESAVTEKKTGFVHMKLFNLVLKELGLHFLERGVYISRDVIRDYITISHNDILEKFGKIQSDGEAVIPGEMKSRIHDPAKDLVFLQVSVE